MKVLVYRKCSTCMKALKWLDEHNISYEERAIKEENPTYEELKEWYTKSGLPLKKFFNTSGMLYKEMGLKDKLKDMSKDEQLKLLATFQHMLLLFSINLQKYNHIFSDQFHSALMSQKVCSLPDEKQYW